MRHTKTILAGLNLIFMSTLGLAHTDGKPAGFMGYCAEGTCHTFADWVGHGVFGLGWFGFGIGFLVWLMLVFAVIHETRKTLAERNKEGQSSE